MGPLELIINRITIGDNLVQSLSNLLLFTCSNHNLKMFKLVSGVGIVAVQPVVAMQTANREGEGNPTVPQLASIIEMVSMRQ
jgi:hypothetical protein